MSLKIMTIPILTIICVFLVVLFYFLPLVEKKLMKEKKIATKHLVEVAFTLISDYHSRAGAGEFGEDDARKKAMMRIRAFRYKGNDYFWINDLHTVMIMHPVKPELEGKNLSNLEDAEGNYPFREFVKVSKEKNGGFVDYFWSKPDSDKPVRKVSYVKLFKPWEWVVGSGIYIDDVDAEIRKMRFQIILGAVVLSVIVLILTYFIAHLINRPLFEAVNLFNQIAGGNLTVTVESGHRQDEIGILMDAFRNMVEKLRSQTRQIREGASTIAASISQISATATQLAYSSSETSSSVSEITTTVEEVRQTVYVSHEKAERVAKSSEQSAWSSETGRKSSEDAVSGMNRIKEEMEYVAESIVTLSEQTQNIGEIISVVNDLADQSHLLSVNASIEAAKSGEHGKGFAVVAQEVKSLAEQSKTATKQIRVILNDIRKATRATVKASERGKKAVEAGVYLSRQSGDSIDMLSQSVTESAQASIQIAASNQEQLAGMDQLVLAMENIKEASRQNADGAKHLETESKNLDDLGRNLRELASMFKV